MPTVRFLGAFITLAVLAGSCTTSADNVTVEPDPTATPAQETPTATATAVPDTPVPATTVPTVEPTATPTPEPAVRVSVEITGDEEVVFDWTRDQCEVEHIPDIAARAIRDADGQVQLTIGHYVNYRMVGPDLSAVENDCTLLLASDFDPDPSQFNDSVWLGGLATDDGETMYAVVHNEYRGDTHDDARPGQCPSSDRFTCLDTSLTMYISTNGGDSYEPIAPPPNHLIASLPYVFNDQGRPTGLRQPSNLLTGPDGFTYLFANASTYPNEEQWMCAMRSDDLSDPTSWRFWDGAGFNGVFVNPYLEDTTDADLCAPYAPEALSASIGEAVVFDETVGEFIAFGPARSATGERFGVYYATSKDLITWSPRRLLIELPVFSSEVEYRFAEFLAYTSFLDPNSTSLNFDTSTGSGYLYLTRFNAGTFSLDRDLLRWPVSISQEEVLPPDWTFDTAGDLEGWFAQNHAEDLEAIDGSLTTTSTGDDISLAVDTWIPASYNKINVSMRVTDPEDVDRDIAQFFFSTLDEPIYGESTSKIIEIRTDGEFHDYVFDFSSVPAWDATITSLRFDPGIRVSQTIEIDRIWLSD